MPTTATTTPSPCGSSTSSDRLPTAVFPGSFDPFTAGHEAIARRVAPLFGRLVVAIGVNSDKHSHFGTDERMALIRRRLADLPNVSVVSYSGMTVDLCRREGARIIVRGIRDAADLEYEQTVAAVNRAADPTVETFLVMADEAHRHISSTLERERLLHPTTP